MNPEVKQQLYGGEISDYMPKPPAQQKSIEQDNKNLSNLYQQVVNKDKFKIKKEVK